MSKQPPSNIKMRLPLWLLTAIWPALLLAGCAKPLPPAQAAIPAPPPALMVVPSRGHLQSARTSLQMWQGWLTDTPTS